MKAILFSTKTGLLMHVTLLEAKHAQNCPHRAVKGLYSKGLYSTGLL
jgi:hypothetical protein